MNTEQVINILKESKVTEQYLLEFVILNYNLIMTKKNTKDFIYYSVYSNMFFFIIFIENQVYVADSNGEMELIHNQFQFIKAINNNQKLQFQINDGQVIEI